MSPRRISMEWSEEMCDALTWLWAEGHSTRMIAFFLDCSKNAVVGKAHRLDLSPRPSPIVRNGAPLVPLQPRVLRSHHTVSDMTAPKQPKPPPSPRPVVVLPPPRPPPEPVVRRCQFPYGDPKEKGFHFCGRPVARGAYCQEHYAICHIQRREQVAA